LKIPRKQKRAYEDEPFKNQRHLDPELGELLVLGTGSGSDGANTNPKLAMVGWRSPTGKTMDAFANMRW
jgi:hypothetical protein